MKAKKIFLFIAVIFFLSFGAYFGQQYYAKFQKGKQEYFLYETQKSAWQELQQRVKAEISQFKGDAGVVIKDLETGWEFSYQKAKMFPSASLAKVPLMATCFLAVDQGRFKLKRNIALKSADKLTGSGVLKDMPAGAIFTVERLIGLMIYDSDNTAANILTNLIGIDYLNNAFKDFGLKNTDLSRKIADYQSRDEGIENYTTAEDMALLLEKMYRRVIGNKNVSDQCINVLKLTRMNDRIPKYLPPEITVAHKTGLERGVCHDAGIVFTRKGDFIIAVLTKHLNSNSAPSKEFIAKVSLYAYKYFEQLP
ncbi:MAG: class A beta-lactamase-related serine hydrolase [Candidatus Omnitrophica bacterium]|nr:class A beta-lactamase-related serine hydrolase [Candidatus Omnitrophota bacterium]MDD5592520.1 class A beta-lactamase-related serine hydrolase [Candidatus Omnitrophota bacterium]